MADRQKLEQVLDLLINEDQDQDKATELLHQYMVERAREVYESLLEDEDDGDVNQFINDNSSNFNTMYNDDWEAAEKDFIERVESAGHSVGNINSDADPVIVVMDKNNNFVAWYDFENSTGFIEQSRDVYEDRSDEIDDDSDEIDDDEVGDMDDEGMDDEGMDMDDEGMDMDMDDMGGDTEDRIEDLETALADLRAEFDRLMSDEDDMGMDMDMDDEGMDMGDMDDMDDEEELVDDYQYDGLAEATKLQDLVSDPGMGTEGKFAGTGAKSKNGSVNKESPYTRMSPRTTDGEPTDFVGKDEPGQKAGKAKNHTPSSNVRVKQGSVKHGHDAQKGEGKYSGTGKGSKNGSVNTKSALGSSNSPKGK